MNGHHVLNSANGHHSANIHPSVNGHVVINGRPTINEHGATDEESPTDLSHESRRVTNWSPFSCLSDSSDAPIALIKLNTQFGKPADVLLFKRLWIKAKIRAFVDGGANAVYDHESIQRSHFIPTIVSGDFDSIRADVLQFYRDKEAEIIATPDQNETDFTKCLNLVIERLKSLNSPIDKIMVHVNDNGRLDHILANINTLYLSSRLSTVPVLLIHEQSISFILPAGEHIIDIDSPLRGNWCSLIPIGSPVDHVTTTGLVYPLKDQPMCFGDLISTSNAFDGSKQVSISTSQSLLWTMGIDLTTLLLDDSSINNNHS